MKSHCFEQSLSLHRRAIAIMLIVLSAFLIIAWTSGYSQQVAPGIASISAGISATPPAPTRVFYLNTGTPLPADYFDTQQQANQILIGAAIMVLIVLISTAGALLRKKGD